MAEDGDAIGVPASSGATSRGGEAVVVALRGAPASPMRGAVSPGTGDPVAVDTGGGAGLVAGSDVCAGSSAPPRRARRTRAKSAASRTGTTSRRATFAPPLAPLAPA